jgi:uncharacterized DUF497 family protein
MEWDPAKDEANKRKHGFGFVDTYQVLEGLHVTFPSSRGDEERFGAIGLINGHYVVVFYTMRGSNYRIISIRRARPNERRKHRQIHQRAASEHAQ